MVVGADLVLVDQVSVQVVQFDVALLHGLPGTPRERGKHRSTVSLGHHLTHTNTPHTLSCNYFSVLFKCMQEG